MGSSSPPPPSPSSSTSSSSSCFFKRSSLCFVVSLLLFYALFGSVLSPTSLTCLILISSTVIFFTFTKKKSILKENSMPVEALISQSREISPTMEIGLKTKPELEIIRQERREEKEDDVGELSGCAVGSQEMLPEKETISVSSKCKDYEDDGSCPDNVGQIPACSDCSISDDESLIEIELPDVHYIESDDPKEIFSPESVFRQHGLMELFSEINESNEDDNLFEIDISMGPINCSRLEIEA